MSTNRYNDRGGLPGMPKLPTWLWVVIWIVLFVIMFGWAARTELRESPRYPQGLITEGANR
jgi:hypothetical protein